MKKPPEKCGLTLIEVLLASAILSISLAVMLTGASNCLKVIHRAKEFQTAQWALNKGELAYPIVNTNDVMGLAVGPVEFDEGFAYERIVEEDDDEDNLFVVRNRVLWSKRGGENVEEVVRYVLQADK